MTELVAASAPVSAPTTTIFDMAPQALVGHVSQIATVLRDVINKQRLAVNIQGREYVKVDGWAAMGTILGLLPREVDVKEMPDGSYEAKVELYSIQTGKVVGQGSALCGVDEKRWGSADRYARRSMAITRATGKAYRLGLSWVMAMAGYAPTPYEEMPVDEAEYFEKPSQARAAARSQTRPAASPKTASIYEGTVVQNEALEKILKAQQVPQDRWPEVQDKLMGRPSTDIKMVLQEVMQ